MARPLRIKFNGAWYHVMNRGLNHGNLFFNNKHRHTFFKILEETIEIYGIKVHAYCLMSNHYHFLIHTPRGNINYAMQYLNSNYARYLNFSMNRDGPLFRGRYFAKLVDADNYFLNVSRYIHLNPLAAKMIRVLSDHPWSSYLCYIGEKIAPAWLSTMETISRLGENDFCNKYKKFVESDSDDDIEKFYINNPLQPVVGKSDFRETINDYVNSHSISSEIVGARHILEPPTMIAIVDLVAQHFKVAPTLICNTSHTVKNPARRVAIYLCRKVGGYHLHEIGKFMGNISYKTVSNALCRIKLDDELMKVADILGSNLSHPQVKLTAPD